MSAEAKTKIAGGWPWKSGPFRLPVLKINPAAKSESPSPLAAVAGIRQRLKRIESQRPSKRVWCGVATGAL